MQKRALTIHPRYLRSAHRIPEAMLDAARKVALRKLIEIVETASVGKYDHLFVHQLRAQSLDLTTIER